LTAQRILIALAIMGLYASLDKLMEKARATMDFGLKKHSSLDLLLRKKISLNTNLAV